MDKNIYYLKWPNCKIKPQFNGNFVEKAKERSLKYKNKIKLALKKGKIKAFKI